MSKQSASRAFADPTIYADTPLPEQAQQSVAAQHEDGAPSSAPFNARISALLVRCVRARLNGERVAAATREIEGDPEWKASTDARRDAAVDRAFSVLEDARHTTLAVAAAILVDEVRSAARDVLASVVLRDFPANLRSALELVGTSTYPALRSPEVHAAADAIVPWIPPRRSVPANHGHTATLEARGARPALAMARWPIGKRRPLDRRLVERLRAHEERIADRVIADVKSRAKRAEATEAVGLTEATHKQRQRRARRGATAL